MALRIAMISYICRQLGDGTGIRDSALDGERLKDPVGPGRRFTISLSRPENATAARKDKNTPLLHAS